MELKVMAACKASSSLPTAPHIGGNIPDLTLEERGMH